MWQSFVRTAWVAVAIIVLLLGFLGLWRASGASLTRCRRALLFAVVLGEQAIARAAREFHT